MRQPPINLGSALSARRYGAVAPCHTWGFLAAKRNDQIHHQFIHMSSLFIPNSCVKKGWTSPFFFGIQWNCLEANSPAMGSDTWPSLLSRCDVPRVNVRGMDWAAFNAMPDLRQSGGWEEGSEQHPFCQALWTLRTFAGHTHMVGQCGFHPWWVPRIQDEAVKVIKVNLSKIIFQPPHLTIGGCVPYSLCLNLQSHHRPLEIELSSFSCALSSRCDAHRAFWWRRTVAVAILSGQQQSSKPHVGLEQLMIHTFSSRKPFLIVTAACGYPHSLKKMKHQTWWCRGKPSLPSLSSAILASLVKHFVSQEPDLTSIP